MAALLCGSYAVAGGDESSDSDEGGWDIGIVRQEPQQLDQMLQVEKNEALKKALFHGDVSLIEELLNSGISIETSFQFGWTPLMCAASVANSAVVRLLLDRGANACFEIGKYTVLMAACTAQASEENILKTVELLLSRNADPNLTCRKQMTALMYAARKGYARVVALLVAHGSHINAQDENGYSEQDLALRELLIMKKDDLIKIGITNPGDQEKLLGAINELQVDEKRLEDFSEVLKLELSEDEFCKFLQKLNKECNRLIIPVQNMNNHFRKNSHKMVLQWAPTETYIELCKDLVCSVKKLEEEVAKLKDLVVEKLYQETEESDVSSAHSHGCNMLPEEQLAKDAS
ncbi:ankyrin repeat, SAM and basic leucine zipper domain-containing protein 1 isoform X7 [Pitangus sulphuratus]|nr:ankyrin repeat, SAM and basic leucine zipper domain-containing protein 1 isoform X7 [Pitangus sulphuratus]